MSLLWTQRSVDTFLGLPFNVASYCILLYMIAQVTGYKPHRLIGSFGDIHLYVNHLEQVNLQLSRQPWESPRLVINPTVQNIDDFSFSDIVLKDYIAHPSIKAEVAI